MKKQTTREVVHKYSSDII